MSIRKTVACVLALAATFASRGLMAKESAAAATGELTGRVVDGDGAPVADATLLVVQKTWPGGQFQQVPFTTQSDTEGKFSLPNFVPDSGQFEVQVAAFRPGYAFASNYQTVRANGPRNLKPITLRLVKAPAIALVIQDRNGQPVARARAVPGSRQASRGEAQLIYFMGSEPIQAVADNEGRVDLNCFVPGDKAVVNIQLPGKEWEEHKIRIPKDAKTITIAAKAESDAAPAQAGGSRDVKGQVLDSDGEPVADATLLVYLKSWPEGQFRLEPVTTTSDAEGQFNLPDVLPAEGRYEILAAAFRSGYAFASNYQAPKEQDPRTFKPITFRLAKAAHLALVVKDRKGRPADLAVVVPSSRQSAGSEPQLIYLAGSEPIQTDTDEEGRVDLDYFAPGDKAVINIQLPGKDWEEHKIRVPKDGGTLTVSAKEE